MCIIGVWRPRAPAPPKARTHLPLCSGVVVRLVLASSLPFAPACADLSLSEASQIGSPDKMQDASRNQF